MTQANLIDAAALPDCGSAAQYPDGTWQWTDPSTGVAPFRSDPSGIWQRGQLIAPPDTPHAQPAWLAQITAWRDRCRPSLGITLNETRALFDEPGTWETSAFIHVQMHPFDRFFYDHEAGQYTVKRWVSDLRERFGGIDAALIWPTYPMLGIDDRNAYDMIRAMPGHEAGLKSIVNQLHQENVRVLWPLMPWDTGVTRVRVRKPSVRAELRVRAEPHVRAELHACIAHPSR